MATASGFISCVFASALRIFVHVCTYTYAFCAQIYACACYVLSGTISGRLFSLTPRPVEFWKGRALPLNIAHRGGQAERPENTLMAFRYSVETCHCQMLELDVFKTKDDKIVVVHDDNLLRITGKDVCVSESNFQDLPKLLPSEELQKCFFEFIPNFNSFPEPFPAQPLVLLEDVFIAFPETIINIDLKGDYQPRAVELLSDLIIKYNRSNLTILAGFDQTILDALEEKVPNAIISLGPTRITFLLCMHYLGLLKYSNVWEGCLEFPVSKAYARAQMAEFFAPIEEFVPLCLQSYLSKAIDVFALAKHWALCNPRFIKALELRGVAVFGWVANEPHEFTEALVRVGCHGVMTDRPMNFQRFIEQMNIKQITGGESRN